MSRGKRTLGHICRCLNCKHKTHHSRWATDDIGEICPVCDSPKGYSFSTHYIESEILKTDRQIQEARHRWKEAQRPRTPVLS